MLTGIFGLFELVEFIQFYVNKNCFGLVIIHKPNPRFVISHGEMVKQKKIERYVVFGSFKRLMLTFLRGFHRRTPRRDFVLNRPPTAKKIGNHWFKGTTKCIFYLFFSFTMLFGVAELFAYESKSNVVYFEKSCRAEGIRYRR